MTRRGILAVLDGTHARVGRRVALSLQVLIVLSAFAIALETEPGLPPGLQRFLYRLELFILAVFSAEYVLRLYCAPRRWRWSSSRARAGACRAPRAALCWRPMRCIWGC